MTQPAETADATTHSYRLRGDVGGGERSFALAAGDNPIGSGGDNRVVLPVRGVSHRHATLTVTARGPSLIDLGSKNGTFVNGRRVRESPLAPGDEVRFGEAALRLERVDRGDVEIALPLAELPVPAGRSSREETERVGDDGSERDQPWLPLVAALVDRLTVLPQSDLPGALGTLAGGLGGTGAALVEWDAGGGPVILAAAGEIGGAPRLGDLPARARPGEPAVGAVPGEPRATAAARRGRDGETLALVVWGEPAAGPPSVALLAAALRLFDRFRPQSRADLESPRTAAADPDLAFPDGYLPGESPEMVSLYQQMKPLLAADLPVVIAGETGAGKEPLARALHLSSPRRDGPFVAINCAAIPGDLLEAELFGIGAGVATGVRERPGKFSEADGGTLLLDEIADLPQPLQAKLLRVLQEGEVQPLGRPAFRADVRIVASTNADLLARVAAGSFRGDLYYRVAGYVLRVPPLRHRPGDLPRLIGHFTRRFCAETGKVVRGITVKALRALTDYPWPGNVRELEHEVRRLVYLCPHGEAIDSRMLSEQIAHPPPRSAGAAGEAEGTGTETLVLADHLERVERRLIERALRRSGGNQSQAARLLRISRNGLAQRLKRLGIRADGVQER